MTFGLRLRDAIKLANSSRKLLGNHLNISEQAVGMVIRNETQSFTAENCVKAARFLEVDPYWLATGMGEPRAEVAWPYTSITPSEFFALDPLIRQGVEDQLLAAVKRQKLADEANRKQA